MTMQLIQHQELGSAQASITFSSIPQTYTDLYLLLSTRAVSTIGVTPKFNGSTANFSARFLEGTGSGASSYTATNLIGYTNRDNASTASTFGNTSIYIPNYRAATAKSISLESVTENNGTTAYQLLGAVLWNVTDAITSIEVYPDNASNFVQYSSATLYGILKGSDGLTTVS